MSKLEWFFVIFPLIGVWILDQATKVLASSLVGIHEYGPLKLVLFHNHGAMLGLFSELPALLRVVSLSTGGAFLVGLYVLIQYLLPIKSLMLRSGLSFLLGGILGNVTDRIRYGYIIDFIAFGHADIVSPVFNFADALQWVGYGMMAYALIKDGDLLWPENDTRKKFWINKQFQLKYCYFLMAVGLILSLIGFFFSYTYLKVTIQELVGPNSIVLHRFIYPFIVTYAVITAVFCASLFAVGKLISHRMAGPIFAFEKFISDVLQQKPEAQEKKFRLRKKDEFQELENLAHRIQTSFQEKEL
jgi:signal peptidase II